MENQNFEYICADCSGKINHLFSMDYPHEYDCHDTGVIWESLTFYGVPYNLSDEQLDEIGSGDYKSAVKLGSLFGCMILCKLILSQGEDPHMVCDDLDGDLEYVMSALQDTEQPLDIDPEQDVFYIHEFEMEEGYNNMPLKARILDELPGLVLTFLHVLPDIVAFFPSPLEYEPDLEVEERKEAVLNIVSQKLNSHFEKIANPEAKNKENGELIQFGERYQLTEDEINIFMRRRFSESSYPECAKDKHEFDFYKANGFEEAGNSRLLYKFVEIE